MREVETITVAELTTMSETMYGDLVKAVADVSRSVLVVDAELHVDEEQYLLESGSRQADLWGFNLHPPRFGTEHFIEFDSMVNIRPRQKNRSRGVEDPAIREQIIELVSRKVVP